MSDLSSPTRINENRISVYQGLNKTADMPGRLLSTNRTLNPIDRLPPELAASFIRNALSSHDHLYPELGRPSRLVELTAVSKRWQSFLFSTAILWSELVIDEEQEDFLATLSVFVALSGKIPLKLTFRREPVDWTGLASLLLPVAQHITSLSFEGHDDLEINWIYSVIPTVFTRLGHLPRLKEVNFDVMNTGVSLLQIESLPLPSTVKIKGNFQIEMPQGCWDSGTSGRLFDTHNTFAALEPISPPSNLFNLRYSVSNRTTIRSNGATLPQLGSIAGRLAERNCFEQVVCRTTRHLQELDIYVHLSEVQDAIDCLRLLMRLQTLELYIKADYYASTLNWAPNNTACRDLRTFSVIFQGDEVPGIVLSAQGTLRYLFSAFQTLYPSVKKLHLHGHTWPFFASSYLQSLRDLKSLSLGFTDSTYNPAEGSINLQSLQYLKIEGPPYFDSLRMPNLLKLTLALPNLDMWPPHLSHPRIRSLTLTSYRNAQDFKVLSLDCTDLRHLRLDDIPLRATSEHLSLSNVVTITLTSQFAGVVNPSSNLLCLTLLCNPEQFPCLQQLHFNTCIDWDILLLMLHTRNIGQNGVHRIDTVTLPFMPFDLQQSLARILAAESMELPPLESLSLEATREVMFDSTVYVYISYTEPFTDRTQSPGCLACLHGMRPGCTARVSRRTDGEWGMRPADHIYPVESITVGAVPAGIRGWLSLRRDLIYIWRASYEEFSQEFVRYDVCGKFPRVWL
jgi:hypothetical protein